ncbi:hypothetical protein GW742_16545 [Citrobacter freundii]|nr:hypothetical protein [Citrobacter freundii]MBC6507904.1 hypothetical protein [Citrobacter freundii]
MSVLISGILRDGAGKPVQDCTIQLSARKTSPTVVVEVTSSTLTGADGHYSIEAEPGYYSVSLLREGFPPALAGDIYVVPTDAPDTLNAFLDAPKDADLRPEVMKRFEEMVNCTAALCQEAERDRERAEQAAQSAAQSKDSTALSATAAAESQRQAALSAETADASARSAADNARQTAQDVLASAADADSAAKSAQTATEQAGQAKTAAETAQKAQEDAGVSAQSAAGSAESAAASAQTAGEHVRNTAISEQAAQESERNAAGARDESGRNALRAENAATASEEAATAAEQSEQAARDGAGEAGKSAEDAAESARLAAQSKDAAATSERNAKDSESAAAQSAEDATTTLAGTLKAKNNLSEFAQVDNEALKQIHGNLKLGAAAQRRVDSGGYGAGNDPSMGVMQTGAYGLGGEVIAISPGYGKPMLPLILGKPTGHYRLIDIASDKPNPSSPPVMMGDMLDWRMTRNAQTKKVTGILFYWEHLGRFYHNICVDDVWQGWQRIYTEKYPDIRITGFGAVGSYALMSWNKAIEFQSGGFYPDTPVTGSNLVWANIPGPGETQELSTYPSAPAGTWRILARLGSATQTALFYRIA